MRRASLLAVFLAGVPVLAAETEPPRPLPEETIGQFEERLLDQDRGAAHAGAAKEIAAKTTAASPPAGFAGRVNDALADFLPYLQGAISGISTSEDEKSITLKFNPVKWKSGETAFSATLLEPQVSKPLLDAIVEPAREAQRQVLLGQVDDWGDLTVTAAYGYLRRAETWESPRIGSLFGRDYATYRPLVDALLVSALDSIPLEIDAQRQLAEKLFARAKVRAFEAAKRTACKREAFDELVLTCLESVLSHAEYQELLEGILRKAGARVALYRTIREWNLAGGIPELIDNQPQLTATLSYGARDAFVGPDSYALSVSYELGFRNFNTVIRQYRWLKRNTAGAGEATPFQAFRDVMSQGDAHGENKLVFGLSYKRVRDFSLAYAYQEAVTDPGTGSQVLFARTANVDLPDSSELAGKLQWGRFLGRSREGGPQPRIDVAAEYLNVSDETDRQDRLIVRATYTHPISASVSFPITVTYANRGELLGEQERDLGAHVGLSYKLSRD